MKRFSLEQLAYDEKGVEFQTGDSFLLSYREFIAYFANLKEITQHNLIISAYFTFGWMPTKLVFKTQDFPSAVDILNKAKQGRLIEEKELQALVDMFCNSLVGTSKLLHFTNPYHYAILDKRVYKYINGGNDNGQLNEPKNYLAFLKNCKEITLDERFGQIHASMNRKIGYDVTPYRALELVMFMNGCKPY